MKKKLLAVLMIAVLAPAMIFAGDFFQVGANIGYSKSFSDIQDSVEGGADLGSYFSIENFSFAPEIRLNILFLQLDAVAGLTFGDNYFKADTQLSAGIQFKIASLVRLGAGLGLNMPFECDNGTWYIGGSDVDQAGNAFLNSKLMYKASVGLVLDPIEITANWVIPTEGTFNDFKWNGDIDSSTFSLGCLIGF